MTTSDSFVTAFSVFKEIYLPTYDVALDRSVEVVPDEEGNGGKEGSMPTHLRLVFLISTHAAITGLQTAYRPHDIEDHHRAL
jgi:hypothetical protein